MKTTPQQLAELQSECEKWLDFFHITGWHIYYGMISMKGDNARTTVHYESRQAGIFITDYKLDISIPVLAKHEVIEAFVIGKLKDMALNGKHSAGEIEEETHRVVWLLSRVLKSNQSDATSVFPSLDQRT